ncbi:Bug family tripartite tricarboxylate transporter substrate binding protein [Rhodovarius crocodyli]|nr:tripartite tricarboxylate transporter substrate binding protein [Rhodovarius crocodyli]
MILRRSILATPWLATPALAQSFPTRPVTLVVPFPGGGSLDIITRILQPRLAEMLGGSVVVDNRPGGATVIGTDLVAKAPSDGHAILVMANSFTINATLLPNTPFDARRDFTGVGSIGFNPHVLITAPRAPWRDLAAIRRLPPAQPLTYASFGQGTSSHLGGESLRLATGLNMTHVPYRGGAPAQVDVATGRVDVMFSNLPDALPLIRDGRLRALAVADTARHPTMPDVPTLAELGLPQVVSNSWFAMVTRAGAPMGRLEKLNEALNAALAEEPVRARFAELGFTPNPMPLREFNAFLADEFERNAQLIREGGITPG